MKKIVYGDMDRVLVEFMLIVEALPSDISIEYTGCLDEVPRLFPNMKPLPSVAKASKEVCDHYSTYLLSTTWVLNRS